MSHPVRRRGVNNESYPRYPLLEEDIGPKFLSKGYLLSTSLSTPYPRIVAVDIMISDHICCIGVMTLKYDKHRVLDTQSL